MILGNCGIRSEVALSTWVRPARVMTPERFRQLEAAFDAAADLPADERGAVLDRLCVGDPELRAEVEALLAATVDATARIQGAIVSAAVDAGALRRRRGC